jgi:hypothetical protein
MEHDPLFRIAERLGKADAVSFYREGAVRETDGNVAGAIVLYKKAFRIWPALDSVVEAGVPKCVREEAQAVGFICEGLFDVIDVQKARASRVIKSSVLLNASDLQAIEEVRKLQSSVDSPLQNNPQNATHSFKQCIFLNNPPSYLFGTQAPQVLAKILQFGAEAWKKAEWSGSIENPGPLHAITGGYESLSIRLVETWSYEVGGGLFDPFHYDTDSAITLVALLSNNDEFEGGGFHTNEVDGQQLEHPMSQGDVICFVAHKYHNIAEVTKGRRRSMVIELWQGGTDHMGRGD